LDLGRLLELLFEGRASVLERSASEEVWVSSGREGEAIWAEGDRGFEVLVGVAVYGGATVGWRMR